MREMKDSGIEWIGAIPTTWHTQKMKYISNFIQNKYSNDYGLLPYIGLENIASWSGSFISTNSQYDREQSLICEPEDILFGKLRPYLAKVYMNDRLCCCSNEFAVIRVNGQNKRYMWYQLLSHGFIFEIDRSTYGTKMPRANVEFIRNVFVALPSEIEQQKIANYLDKMCAEIDTVLEKTRASIEEYKKLKQAVITQAVTKGIRGDRPMKNSGIEWIGDIPAEWEIRKIFRAINKVGDIDHYMPDSVDDGIPYLMTGDLQEKLSDVNLKRCKKVSFQDYEMLSSKIRVSKGDVIFARYATIGTVCFVDTEDNILVSYACLIIKPNSSLLYGEFLFYYLKSTAFLEEIKQYIKANTQANVGLDSVSKAKIVLPSVHEQQKIVEYLRDKCKKIDALIAKKQQYLTEIENYKKSLIYEYVTGKKEVV